VFIAVSHMASLEPAPFCLPGTSAYENIRSHGLVLSKGGGRERSQAKNQRDEGRGPSGVEACCRVMTGGLELSHLVLLVALICCQREAIGLFKHVH
jgi:hypothetical protein